MNEWLYVPHLAFQYDSLSLEFILAMEAAVKLPWMQESTAVLLV